MKKWTKIVHWMSTSLISILMTISAFTYILFYEDVADTFREQFGFPIWLIYPMAVAKLSAVMMLLTKFHRSLTEWAYAGLTFNLLLAIGTHISLGEDQAFQALIALLLVLISYATWKRLSRLESEGE